MDPAERDMCGVYVRISVVNDWINARAVVLYCACRPRVTDFPYCLRFGDPPPSWTRSAVTIFFHTIFAPEFAAHLGAQLCDEETKNAIRAYDTEVVVFGCRLGLGPGWARRSLGSVAKIRDALPPCYSLRLSAPACEWGPAVVALGSQSYVDSGDDVFGDDPAAWLCSPPLGAEDWVDRLLLEV